MGIFQIARTYRSLTRLRHILNVAARHGFGELIDRLNLTHHVPRLKRFRRLPPEEDAELSKEESLARRARLVLEELGPTFVKLGQMLSTRPDLLPPAFLAELGKLREHVKCFSFEEVKKRIEEDLGGKIEEMYREVDRECLASGSIAQVHGAVTTDGRRVVVKVKRPGIDKVIMMDIDLMTQLAALLEKRVPELAVFRPMMVVEEFARGIKRELDFIQEATQTERFAAAFEDNGRVRIPRVFWECTTTSVLTLERIEGVSLSRMEELGRRGVDKKELARLLADVFMDQFFTMGLFHADPHAGNLFLMDGGVLAILDFGLVGRLTEEMRDQLGMVMIAVVHGDARMIADVIMDMGMLEDVDRTNDLRADLLDLVERHYEVPLKHFSMRKLLLDIMEAARKHHATLPREYVLLARAFSQVEGIARELDPDFDIQTVAKPYARKLLSQQFAPSHLAKRAGRRLWDLTRFLDRTPRKIGELVNRLLAGKLGFTFEHRGLESFTLELERASNRLSFSIIVAALIVGSSLMLLAKVGPTYGTVPVLGIIGYCTAAVMGLWLLLAILRRGRL
jgi:ubiquinone biosynthesis protein